MSTSAGMPTIRPLTVAAARSAGQKSFQPKEVSPLMNPLRATVFGLFAMFAAHEPYRYARSGGFPPAIEVSTFCRA